MEDTPYTTPDEDPFSVKPLLQQPRRRRSSMLDKWIKEQQFPSPLVSDSPASHIQTSFDHPHESRPSDSKQNDDDATVNSYDLVQDEDIPCDTPIASPTTPTRSPSCRTSKILHTPSSFRNFNLPFRSNSPSQPTTSCSSRPSSRLSFLPKSPRGGTSLTVTSGKSTTQQHNRSSSLSTLHPSGNCASPRSSIVTAPSRWRPSVLGHFPAASRMSSQDTTPQIDSTYAPSRPSLSSGETMTTATGASENELGNFFTKLSLVDSIRSRGTSNGSLFKSRVGSTSSVWSQTQMTSSESPRSGSSQPPPSLLSRRASAMPRSSPPAFDEDLDGDDDEDIEPPPPQQASTSSKRPQIAYSSGGALPRVHFSSLTRRHKKKRRLVVSGIKPNDSRKFDNLKRWCESFGEVSQITRMPNNDLHVHFRRADVADTVCRLRAKVSINGVGSVQLSWTYGGKR
ncbi:hypothetical protein AX17_000026 [Amanita inopinata Kibby_2008]|nr:hypothetical protein AX17_000026 [Amanita inopinata Kibby_2008]